MACGVTPFVLPPFAFFSLGLPVFRLMKKNPSSLYQHRVKDPLEPVIRDPCGARSFFQKARRYFLRGGHKLRNTFSCHCNGRDIQFFPFFSPKSCFEFPRCLFLFFCSGERCLFSFPRVGLRKGLSPPLFPVTKRLPPSFQTFLHSLALFRKPTSSLSHSALETQAPVCSNISPRVGKVPRFFFPLSILPVLSLVRGGHQSIG